MTENSVIGPQEGKICNLSLETLLKFELSMRRHGISVPFYDQIFNFKTNLEILYFTIDKDAFLFSSKKA